MFLGCGDTAVKKRNPDKKRYKIGWLKHNKNYHPTWMTLLIKDIFTYWGMTIIQINDDLDLLEEMIADAKDQPALYHPGPYWRNKSDNALSEIKRCGIQDFRGSSNYIGQSYSDNVSIDIRDGFNFGLEKILRWVTKVYPLRIVYDAQVNLTKSYAGESLVYLQEILHDKPRVRELLKKYKVPYSILGGCLRTVKIDGNDYSIHYLNLLDQHDHIATRIQFDNIRTVFEIGGGFGTNIHLLIENYPNIKKVIYLDIPPNLYVATQYLKAFYGKSVYDYQKHKKVERISFSDTDDLEIYCIAPWQIEKLNVSIDIFINSHSFVEMPERVVSNYVNYIMKLLDSNKSVIALTTYDNFDLNTTMNPARMPIFFQGRKFVFFKTDSLLDRSRKNLHFISLSSCLGK